MSVYLICSYLQNVFVLWGKIMYLLLKYETYSVIVIKARQIRNTSVYKTKPCSVRTPNQV